MDDALTLLTKLLAIPSVNPMGRPADGPEFFEGRLTTFLEEWLRPFDLEVRRQPVSPGRDNLLATYHAPRAKRHWLLEVHQDTVPIVGMTVPPFAATREGDRVYGRGACDDKGPMTSMLLALARLSQERPAGSADVTLALTVDEEFAFSGVRELVRGLPRIDGAIAAEPTDLNIVTAHKGGARWDVLVHGVACHSSVPGNGVNAIYRMGKVLGSLERFAASLTTEPRDPLLGGPTLSVGVIDGGSAVNVVPDLCRIEVDRRLIPGETPIATQAACVAFLAADPTIDFPVDCRDPWFKLLPMSDSLNQALSARLRDFILPYRPACELRAEPYGSDASTLHAAGVPTVIFGPGSISKAHTHDEWVPLSEVVEAAEILFDFCGRE